MNIKRIEEEIRNSSAEKLTEISKAYYERIKEVDEKFYKKLTLLLIIVGIHLSIQFSLFKSIIIGALRVETIEANLYDIISIVLLPIFASILNSVTRLVNSKEILRYVLKKVIISLEDINPNHNLRNMLVEAERGLSGYFRISSKKTLNINTSFLKDSKPKGYLIGCLGLLYKLLFLIIILLGIIAMLLIGVAIFSYPIIFVFELIFKSFNQEIIPIVIICFITGYSIIQLIFAISQFISFFSIQKYFNKELNIKNVSVDVNE
jgi:hypothetical protein